MSRLKFTPSEAQKYVALLAQTVPRIQACIKNVDEELLSSPAQKEVWSVAEVLGHLRSCAEVWSDSIYAMLVKEEPFLPDIHPRQWAKARCYTELSFHQSFTVFALQRQELLGRLPLLSAEDWNRAADIGGRRHTIFSQVRRMALHEQEHCQQIEHLLDYTGEEHV